MPHEHIDRLANPTPIGLMGLALGCAALAPAELGLTDVNDPVIWIWMLLTAGVLQIYAGAADLINKNLLGATAFTVYGTLWLISAWQLGVSPVTGPSDVLVKGFIYAVFLMFTLFMTVGFATVSRTMTIVFVSFIVIFAVEIMAAFVPAFHHTAISIAGLLHVLAAVLCVWATAGSVINPLLGKNIFNQGAPLVTGHGIDEVIVDDYESLLRHLQLRKRIVASMYHFWETHAWDWISTSEVSAELNVPPKELAPDFWYLYEKGFVSVDEAKMKADPGAPKVVRITAAGIDYYRELQMGKFKF